MMGHEVATDGGSAKCRIGSPRENLAWFPQRSRRLALLLICLVVASCSSPVEEVAEPTYRLTGAIVPHWSEVRYYPDDTCEIRTTASALERELRQAIVRGLGPTISAQPGPRREGAWGQTRLIGEEDRPVCIVPFAIGDVPEAESYEFHIDRVMRTTFSFEDLAQRSWDLFLCRGQSGVREFVPCDTL